MFYCGSEIEEQATSRFLRYREQEVKETETLLKGSEGLHHQHVWSRCEFGMCKQRLMNYRPGLQGTAGYMYG